MGLRILFLSQKGQWPFGNLFISKSMRNKDYMVLYNNTENITKRKEISKGGTMKQFICKNEEV